MFWNQCELSYYTSSDLATYILQLFGVFFQVNSLFDCEVKIMKSVS